MACRVSLTKKAEKDFDNLSCNTQVTIFEILQTLENFPNCNNLKKLRKPFCGYRVRMGRYRILFTVCKDDIVVYKIKHRKDAYR